jgi:hypothetical protein
LNSTGKVNKLLEGFLSIREEIAHSQDSLLSGLADLNPLKELLVVQQILSAQVANKIRELDGDEAVIEIHKTPYVENKISLLEVKLGMSQKYNPRKGKKKLVPKKSSSSSGSLLDELESGSDDQKGSMGQAESKKLMYQVDIPEASNTRKRKQSEELFKNFIQEMREDLEETDQPKHLENTNPGYLASRLNALLHSVSTFDMNQGSDYMEMSYHKAHIQLQNLVFDIINYMHKNELIDTEGIRSFYKTRSTIEIAFLNFYFTYDWHNAINYMYYSSGFMFICGIHELRNMKEMYKGKPQSFNQMIRYPPKNCLADQQNCFYPFFHL